MKRLRRLLRIGSDRELELDERRLVEARRAEREADRRLRVLEARAGVLKVRRR